jgi:tetratricopeptide (TPR) repeat protein
MFLEKIPYFALSLIFGTVAIFAQSDSNSIRQEIPSLLNKIGVASYSVIFYLNKMFMPIGLSCLYPYSPIKNIYMQLVYLYSLLALIVLITGIIISGKYTRKIIFGSTFFLIIIIPALQFIPFAAVIVADRYTYIPSIGIFFILSTLIYWLYSHKLKTPALLLTAFIIINLFFLTYNRCKVWRDSTSLWNDALSKYPYSALIYSRRGFTYDQQGNLLQTISDYTKAIEIEPNYAHLYNNRGVAYGKQGNLPQAVFDFTNAIEINPNYAKAYYNRGGSYFMAKDYDKAWIDVHKAEELGYAVNPKFLDALKKASGRDK